MAAAKEYPIHFYDASVFDETIEKVVNQLGYEVDEDAFEERFQIENRRLPPHNKKKLSDAAAKDYIEDRSSRLAAIIIPKMKDSYVHSPASVHESNVNSPRWSPYASPRYARSPRAHSPLHNYPAARARSKSRSKSRSRSRSKSKSRPHHTVEGGKRKTQKQRKQTQRKQRK